MSIAIAVQLDLKGLASPLSLDRTSRAMKELAPGALVEVLTTDPGSIREFTEWSRRTGNDLLESSQLGRVFRFVIRKR